MNKVQREKLKSLAIVMLFVSATVLVGIKFNFFERFQIETDYQINTVNLNEIYVENVHASQLIIQLGNGNRTIKYNQDQKYYNEAIALVSQALEQNNSLVEVDVDRYETQQNLKSLEIKFDTPIKSRLLSRSLFLNTNKLAVLDDIVAILIPLVEDSNIYIKTTTKIYRQSLTTRASLPSVDSISSTDYSIYHTLEELYNVPSQAYITLDSPQPQKPYTTSPKINSDQTKETIAQYVLGSKYDFAMKVSEVDGSTSFTYNFGQEHIKFKTSGAIEYINNDTGKESENDFDKTIEAAANFLALLQFDQSSLKIESIQQTTIQNKTGYTIYFMQHIDGYEVYPATQSQYIAMQLIGNKVYSFRGLNRQTANLLGDVDPLSPVEVIELNYGMLQIGYGFETGEQLLTMIESVKQVYHVDSNYILRACYQIKIGSRTFYFDMYTGDEVRNGLG